MNYHHHRAVSIVQCGVQVLTGFATICSHIYCFDLCPLLRWVFSFNLSPNPQYYNQQHSEPYYNIKIYHEVRFSLHFTSKNNWSIFSHVKWHSSNERLIFHTIQVLAKTAWFPLIILFTSLFSCKISFLISFSVSLFTLNVFCAHYSKIFLKISKSSSMCPSSTCFCTLTLLANSF